jgi:hypothetical protein
MRILDYFNRWCGRSLSRSRNPCTTRGRILLLILGEVYLIGCQRDPVYAPSSQSIHEHRASAPAETPANRLYSGSGAFSLRYVKSGGAAGIHEEMRITTIPSNPPEASGSPRLKVYLVSEEGARQISALLTVTPADVLEWRSERRPPGVVDNFKLALKLETSSVTNVAVLWSGFSDSSKRNIRIRRWENLIEEVRMIAASNLVHGVM